MLRIMILFLLVLFVAACQPRPEIVIPTVAVLPSVTPTTIPTKPPKPTWTPSLTPLPTQTPTTTASSTLTPTDLPSTPALLLTPKPFQMPIPTTTSGPTIMPAWGTRSNPVPIGQSFRFPGYGSLTVVSSAWIAGQTGLANVQLSFTCERPADQKCNVLDLMLDAVGGSGLTYQQAFESGVPSPEFWDFMSADVFGGGTKTGYAGFLILEQESTLAMRVSIYLQSSADVFFSIVR